MPSQPHAGGHGVGEGKTASGYVPRVTRATREIAPSIIGVPVDRLRRRIGLIAQSREHQDSHARQTEEMNSGDHQQQLSLA